MMSIVHIIDAVNIVVVIYIIIVIIIIVIVNFIFIANLSLLVYSPYKTIITLLCWRTIHFRWILALYRAAIRTELRSWWSLVSRSNLALYKFFWQCIVQRAQILMISGISCLFWQCRFCGKCIVHTKQPKHSYAGDLNTSIGHWFCIVLWSWERELISLWSLSSSANFSCV